MSRPLASLDMTWLEGGILSIGLFVGGILVVFLRSWFRNFIAIFAPSPQRAFLALKNFLTRRPSAGERVRFILGWLDNDYSGINTLSVSTKFAEIEGIELRRSARMVSASGAADEWRATMRRKGKDLLRAWHADIAIVGRVDKDGDAVSLWFVSSGDNDTLADTTSNPYSLRLNRLPDQFVDDLIVQIQALVLTLAIPKAKDDSRRQLGLQQLKAAVPKLESLFRTFTSSRERISLSKVYVLAQSSLGEWLGEAERLRAAVEKAREVTEGSGIDIGADELLMTRVNLARTLYVLGEREADQGCIAEAINLLEGALEGVDHVEQASLAAGIEGIAANALRVLAHLERNPDHLHRAASLLDSALEVHQRQGEADFVAISRNNLGLVHLDIALASKERAPLEHAISLFDSASRTARQENMPTQWAMTQNNTGQVYEVLAELGLGSDVTQLERSRDHYRKAVRGYSRTETPYHLASAKTNLARVLTRLGALGGSVDYLDQAVECLEDAHVLSSKDVKSTSVGGISAGQGAALLARGKARAHPRDVENAIQWLEKALETYDVDAHPENWIKVKTNLALSYFQLSEARHDTQTTARGFSCLEEVFIDHDLSKALAACPEPYFAFFEGIDHVRSMVHQTDFAREWIGKWFPVFTKREHEGVSRQVLGIMQNDIANVCQEFGGLSDAIELYRGALANMSAHDDTKEPGSSSETTLNPQMVASGPFDPDRLVSDIERNLGTACRMLGEERSCVGLLREAIAQFDKVLAGQDPAVDPMDWAITQSARGRAYKELYHVEGDVELLRTSLSAYDEASQSLVDGMDSPWHQQVPGKREEVRRMLEERELWRCLPNSS